MSLVPLVMVLTVSNGMIKGITERMIGLSSSHLQLVIYSNSEYAKKAESLTELSDAIRMYEPSVKNIYPELQGIGLASSAKGRFGASIRAMEKDIFEKNDAFKNLFEVVEGNTDLSKNNQSFRENTSFEFILPDFCNMHKNDIRRLYTFKPVLTKTDF